MSYDFWWNILTKPPDKDFKIIDLKEFGLQRVNLLKQIQSQRGDRKMVSRTSISPLINSIYPSLMSSNPLMKDQEIFLLGHLFLRFVASVSRKFESWLIETEGDLFEFFFKDLPISDQLLFAQELLGSEDLIVQSDIKLNDLQLPKERMTVDSTYWGVNWKFVPRLISLKRGFVYKGFLFGPPWIFLSTFKKIFEKQLRMEIIKLKDNKNVLNELEFNDLFQSAVKELENEFQGYLPMNTSFQKI
ncbi:MAG: hypothetical protein ACXAC7_23085, partial [Candidatus Hodarchaeales archaeon]